MEQRLREALSRRRKRRITDANLVTSAVLVPIYYKEGQYYILFTKRTERVKEHKGQISFPGGARHKRDRTLLDTALRECDEEIGLAPGEVKVLGELDDTTTETSNYVISPFVALIPYPYQFKVDGGEVEEIIEAPISALLDKDLRQQTRVIGGQAVTSYFYHYQGRVIWGATAEILNQFLGIFSRAMED
jgi:8-oxo-dGTP pyrophosphatase MutT (NUDIX family)